MTDLWPNCKISEYVIWNVFSSLPELSSESPAELTLLLSSTVFLNLATSGSGLCSSSFWGKLGDWNQTGNTVKILKYSDTLKIAVIILKLDLEQGVFPIQKSVQKCIRYGKQRRPCMIRWLLQGLNLRCLPQTCMSENLSSLYATKVNLIYFNE